MIWKATGFSEALKHDALEARRALSLLIEHGRTYELRALPYGRSRICRTVEDGIRAIEEFQHAAGIYYTLNPCRNDLDKSAADKDIASRRWLPIDVDPVRGDCSSTDEEKEAAGQVAIAVMRHLAGLDWPAPLVVDSGNGWHLLYRCDLPNDALAKQWVRSFLDALASQFDTDTVKVDRKVFNASRIMKLPGTWARKGEDSDTRPHRMARLTMTPDPLEVVKVEQLQSVIQKPDKTGKDSIRLVATSGSTDGYLRAAMAGEAGAVALAPNGERNARLNAAAFSLGTLVGAGLNRSDIEATLTHAAKRSGLGEQEIARTIKSGIDAGIMQPREVPHSKDKAKAGEPTKEEETKSVGESGRKYAFPLIVRGQDVTPRQVSWLWDGWIPFGFLTLMAGKTGVGKSFVTLDIVARVSVGGILPVDDGGACFDAGSTLIISEDSHEYVLTPRLMEAGAELSRVSFMSWEAMNTFKLDDDEMLDDCYRAAGCPKLVVIDPPTNFLGQKDEHKNAEVRGVLMRLSIWAMRHDVAVVLITHCNKSVGKGLAALDRIIGSVAWASTSRIAHLFSKHPTDKTRSCVVPLKSNISRLQQGITYEIKESEMTGVVNWLGRVEFDADEIENYDRRPRGVVAVEWLAEKFTERREWLSDELRRDATEAGVSKNALWSPEVNALPIVKRKMANADGVSHWWWIAQTGWPTEKQQKEEA
jgi:RecA-family ATPase